MLTTLSPIEGRLCPSIPLGVLRLSKDERNLWGTSGSQCGLHRLQPLLGQVRQDLVLRRRAVDLAHVERHRVQVGVDPSVIVRSVRRPVELRYHARLAK